MEITVAGSRHVFDSFECAIHAIAPRCEHCGCTIIGHGLEAEGHMFCCAHCASEKGYDARWPSSLDAGRRVRRTDGLGLR
jgi:hypothetical protein